MDQDEKTFTLFVRLPWGNTISVRPLPCNVPVNALLSRVELIASLPSESFVLYHGEVDVNEKDFIAFGIKDLRNGSLLKLCLKAQFTKDDTEVTDIADFDKKRVFTILAQCCRLGDLRTMRKYLSFVTDVQKACSSFGRTLLHFSAAQNQTEVIEMLMSEYHMDPLHPDDFSQTSLDAAVCHGCTRAERFLRSAIHCSMKKKASSAASCPSLLLEESPISCNSVHLSEDFFRFSPSPASQTQMLSSRSSDRFVPSRSSTRQTSIVTIQTQLPLAKPRIEPFQERRSNSVSNPCMKSTKATKATKATTKTASKQQLIGVTSFDFQPLAPCSSPIPSEDESYTKNLKKRSKPAKTYATPTSTPSTFRAQSAKYYKTKFHVKPDPRALPAPRPTTAGPRYREWKTWLSEKVQEDAQGSAYTETQLKRKANIIAFEHWLAKKERMATARQYHVTSSESEPETEMESDCKSLRRTKSKKLQRKRNGVVYHFCNTDPVPCPGDDPSLNIRAYQRWKRNKAQSDRTMTSDRRDQLRSAFLREGMTYDDWLSLKDGGE